MMYSTKPIAPSTAAIIDSTFKTASAIGRRRYHIIGAKIKNTKK